MSANIQKAKLAIKMNEIPQQKKAKLINIPKATKAQISDEKKAEFAKAARGFESMFLNMVFKEMKKNVNTNLGDSEGSMTFGADTLEGYTDMAFTDQMSKSGSGIGIAEKLYAQLTGGEKLGGNLQFQPRTIHELKQYLNSKPSEKVDTVKHKNNKLEIGDTFFERLDSRLDNYKEVISQASSKYGVPQSLIKAVIGAESAGRANAKSGAGAKGLMQLMDGTAKDLGVTNSFDPTQNIMGGTKYLSQMLEKYDGNIDLALAAYNAGPGNVDKHNGVPPFSETQAYIKRVKKYQQILSTDLLAAK